MITFLCETPAYTTTRYSKYMFISRANIISKSICRQDSYPSLVISLQTRKDKDWIIK